MLTRLAALTVLILVPAAASAAPLQTWDGQWFQSISGGSSVELPSFLEPTRVLFDVDGVSVGSAFDAAGVNSFWAQQYRADSEAERPFEYLARRHAGEVAVVTYTLDKESLGVISGYADDKLQTIFYEACRTGPEALRCVSLGWASDDQSMIGPLIEHIVATFRVEALAKGF